jgi:hypothetical protein
MAILNVMNLSVLYESFIIGAKEGLKAGVILIVFYSFIQSIQRQNLIRPFYAGLFTALLFSIPFLLFKGFDFFRNYIEKIIGLSFAVVFLISGLSLLHKTETDLFSLIRSLFKTNVAFWSKIIAIIIYFATIFYFLPDFAGSALFVKDYSMMKETIWGVYIPVFFGFLVVFLISFLLIRSKFKIMNKVGGFFDLSQFFLFLAIVKLLGGGIKGFAELSLIPSVQRGIMKFMHDLIHQVFVLLMVPDHPILRTTLWDFIGFFFGPNISSVLSLFILLFLPILFLYHSLLKPLPEITNVIGAERRKVKFNILSERRRKSVPVFIYIIFILFLWFSGKGEEAMKLYNPAPKPVVSEKGVILIPINDPTMDLFDGRLHKFTLKHEQEMITFLIIKKQNGSLAVCLDACEICPPIDGYGQREDHVVCIYCNTPIPIHTLGEKGGCNPIPLVYGIDDKFVKIELTEIIKKWQYVKAGAGREAVE